MPRFSFSKMRPIAVGERRRKEERGRQRRGQRSLGGESNAKGARLWRSRGTVGAREQDTEEVVTWKRSSSGGMVAA